jgi:hypothetical protein
LKLPLLYRKALAPATDEYVVGDDYFLISHIRHNNRAYALDKKDEKRFADAESEDLFVCFAFKNAKLDLLTPFYYTRAELDYYLKPGAGSV